jgi:hypothetical protein
MAAVGFLTGYGVSYRVLPERLIQPYMLRNRNVLLFGRPEYSPAARMLMETAPFVIEYNPGVRSWVVRNRSPKAGEPPFYEPRTDGKGGDLDVYGLLTVLPSETPIGSHQRTVIFSGLTTAGAKAAEEFFSTPEVLRDLQARFRQEGLRSWPSAWQLVLKTSVADPTLPMSFSYQAHRVIHE